MKLGKYQHFKGAIYEVLGVGTHTETGEKVVLYQSLEDRTFWVRPKAMFEDHVERDDYKGPRFKSIE